MNHGLVLGLGMAVVLVARGASAGPSMRDLDIRAPDGARLRATFYAAPGTGPAVLLLHQCNMDRKSWDPLAAALSRKGVRVLTFDYRGYGDSDGKPVASLTDEELVALFRNAPGDVDAALAALLAQPGVDPDRVAAGGASCGVHQSIQLARRSGRIRALVLLSGSRKALDEGGDYLAANPQIPIFGAASTEDGDSVPTMRGIVRLSKNPETRFRECHDAGHGVPMFSREADLLPAIVDWVSTVLAARPAAAR